MVITNEIIESFLYCQYKSHLKRCGKQGEKTNFGKLQKKIKNQIISTLSQKITAKGKTILIPNSSIPSQFFSKGTDFILKSKFEFPGMQLRVDVLERFHDTSTQRTSYILTLVFPDEHITKTEKLFITCIGILLKDIPEIENKFGKVIYGERLKTSKILYENLLKEAQRILEHLQGDPVPQFYLNRRCSICEFNKYCREEALQNDHLSLLGGIQPKEIDKFNNKGIFTINQLSYTFRPRRQRNKPNNYVKPHSFPLQALALREQKIYVYETPQLPTSNVEIYVDVEGLPDLNFHYLIGSVIKDHDGIKEQYFWANSKDEETQIFQEFLTSIGQYPEYSLFHYGNYEVRYLKKMITSLKYSAQQDIEKILNSCCNILSFFYSNIYLPTYTNGLKDVANLLGFRWSDKHASGVQSVVWRKEWENTQQEALKQKLIQYNAEDCYALMKVKELVETIINNETPPKKKSGIPEIVYPNGLKRNSVFSFQDKNFALPEMELINECAYFDYQKERVHVREKKPVNRRSRQKVKKRQEKLNVNETMLITAKKCSQCGSQKIKKTPQTLSKEIIDLSFFDSGVQRWVTKYTTHRCHCNDCEESFTPEEYVKLRKNFGHKLKSWTIFQHIVNQESFSQIEFNLHELFAIQVSSASIHDYKRYIRDYYESTYEKLLQKILTSDVIYVDETPFKMVYESVYAWIFTNGEEVISVYKPTREGDFLKELLQDFQGILVSDFFQAYDSLNCLQQKCLIHLLRDFNDDLLANPFEKEFKSMTRMFTKLLQDIVKTVDKYGLQKKHLQKHKKDVEMFFTTIFDTQYTSEVAQKYQKRLEKHQNTLFTFLDYDNVSWNNTYAEHAIKLLATHRNRNIKFFRESRIDDYLRIMSLYQTCQYKEISFLKFLLSQEIDIDEYCKISNLEKK
jgi:predicted RecB family nuclease